MANLTGFRRDNEGAYIDKASAANIQYGVDFTDYLNSGDAVSTATVALESITGDGNALRFPTNQATNVTIVGKVVQIRLTGGTIGKEYNVDVTINTANGDTDVRRFRIIISPKHL